jgi:hypothetical protein
VRSAPTSTANIGASRSNGINPDSLLELLVPLFEPHAPFQTGFGVANRLRIQSHRPEGGSDRWWKRKCDACRNYRASKRAWSLSGYWDPCSTKLLYSSKISKKWKCPVCPHVSKSHNRHSPLPCGKQLVCPWLPSQDSMRSEEKNGPPFQEANAKGWGTLRS